MKLPNWVTVLPHVAIRVIYATFHCQSQRPDDNLTATISCSVILPPTISREDPILAPGWPIAKPSPASRRTRTRVPALPPPLPAVAKPPSSYGYEETTKYALGLLGVYSTAR